MSVLATRALARFVSWNGSRFVLVVALFCDTNPGSTGLSPRRSAVLSFFQKVNK